MRFETTKLARPTVHILLVTVCAALSWGQSATSLRGSVKDKQGGAVPDAVIELLQADTGLRRNVTTDASGEYQFSQLPPGNYAITVTKPGFTVLTQRNLELQINTPGDSQHHARSRVGDGISKRGGGGADHQYD